MLVFSSKLKGKEFSCLYRLHGTSNILKSHSGRVEQVGVGPNGLYIKLRESNGQYRTLRADRMVEPKVGT